MKTRLWLGLALCFGIETAVFGGSPPPVAQERPLPESVLGSETAAPTPRPDLPPVFVAQLPGGATPRPAPPAVAPVPSVPPSSPGSAAPSGNAPPPSSTVPPGAGASPRSSAPPVPIAPPAQPPRSDANALAMAQTPNNNSGMLPRTPSYQLASTPKMIGDTLGVGYLFVVESAVGKGRIAGNVPIGDSTVKIGDDTSPLPVDRVFFDYNHFHNALLTANGQDISLNRYTFGLEKTYFDGMTSVELKAPLDGGLNNTQSINASTSANEGTLFGTLAITPKVLLHQSDGWAMSGGLAIGLPTSPNAALEGGPRPIQVFDDSVHLAPFLGLLLTPNDRWFAISYLQFDFDTNGNRVFSDDLLLGRVQDPALMYVDLSVGYWLFNCDSSHGGAGRFLTGMAPLIELHYTTTLQNADGVQGIISPVSERVDILNLTAGFFFKLGPSAGLTVAGVAPLRTRGGDKEFDAEVLVQFNRWF